MASGPPSAAGPVITVDPAQPQQRHLFEISPTLDENRVMNPSPVFISLGLEPSAFPPALGGFPDSTQSPFAQAKGVFDTALRAPGPSSTGTNLIWFFRGDSFFTYEEHPESEDVVGEPVLLADTSGSSFTGDWPPAFASRIDAVVLGTGIFDGQVTVFRGSNFFRFSLADGTIDGPPRSIFAGFTDVGDNFAASIDAGLHGIGDFFGFFWMFKGSDYLRYDIANDQVANGPQPIAGGWGGGTWPAEFAAGIDFAFYGTGSEAEKIFFFRGDKFLRYNLRTDRVEEGPESILKNWPRLAQFIPPPQLFLVEQYEMHAFRGEIGSGGLVPGQQPKVAPRSTTSFFILTKRSETITEREQTNVLESQSEGAVARFSDAVREDKSEAGSKETFDYKLDASFEGEAHMTMGGGEASGDLHAKTNSQDVRNSFGRALANETNRQRDETREIHREQVSVAGKEHQVNEQVETGFFQSIDNSNNPEPLNIELHQLTQEYILVSSLVDAKLAFHNDDPHEARTVPLRDAPALLEKCIVDPTARQRILATLADILSNVFDHEGKKRSLIVPLPDDPDRFAADQTVRSRFEAKNTEGELVRVVDVPGIVIHVDRPVALTTNVEMTLIHGGA
jgi:hypothetical protein